jgi:2-keto-4-pentenoate hydratase
LLCVMERHRLMTPLQVSHLCQPRIEAEIAFLIGERAEGTGVSSADAFTAVAGALPALEIIGLRMSR